MVWIVGGLMLVIMMAVLQIAPQSPSVLPSPETLSLIRLVLIGMAGVLLLWIRVGWAKQRATANNTVYKSNTVAKRPLAFEKDTARDAAASGDNHMWVQALSVPAIWSKISAALRYAVRWVVNSPAKAAMAVTLLLLAGVQAMYVHQVAEMQRLMQPIRVQALVSIEVLSDAAYDMEQQQSYRQEAVITNLRPLAVLPREESQLGEVQNPWAQGASTSSVEAQKQIGSLEQTALPDRLEVMLGRFASKEEFLVLNELQPGQSVEMTLALEPVLRKEQTASGFDVFHWLRSRHVDATANVLSVDMASVKPIVPVTWTMRLNQWRFEIRQQFLVGWDRLPEASQQAKAVTLSLLTGDRALIASETVDLYQFAGISHLLAISGTHVLFLAIMLAALVIWLCDKKLAWIYQYVARWQVRWLVMVVAAFIYALFTGFDVPAARTAWMLCALGLVRMTLLPIKPLKVLLVIAVAMAVADPYVLWQAGYWLSFVAVALLLQYELAYGQFKRADDAASGASGDVISSQHFMPKYVIEKVASESLRHKTQTIGRSAWALVKLQLMIFITLLPLTLLLFGKVSLWGLVVNVFAIGIYGWLLVPLDMLAGVLYLLSPVMADKIWNLVTLLLLGVHAVIDDMSHWGSAAAAWIYTEVTVAVLILAMLAILPWLLPRSVMSRWLSVPCALLMGFIIYNQQVQSSSLPRLYKIATDDDSMSVQLLAYQSDTWLLMADFESFEQARRYPKSESAINNMNEAIVQQLGALGVTKLTGVIVQTATFALAQGIESLTKQIKIGEVWQAGNLEQATLENTAVLGRKQLSIKSCEAGQTWTNKAQNLRIEALTGWAEIDDAGVWSCALAIESDEPMQMVTKNTAANTAKSQADEKTLPHRVIVDAAIDKRLWALWALICESQQMTGQQVTASQMNTSQMRTGAEAAEFEMSEASWYTHSASPVSRQALDMLEIGHIEVVDENAPMDEHNLLEWQSQKTRLNHKN